MGRVGEAASWHTQDSMGLSMDLGPENDLVDGFESSGVGSWDRCSLLAKQGESSELPLWK